MLIYLNTILTHKQKDESKTYSNSARSTTKKRQKKQEQKWWIVNLNLNGLRLTFTVTVVFKIRLIVNSNFYSKRIKQRFLYTFD